jgi:hypothetical protein
MSSKPGHRQSASMSDNLTMKVDAILKSDASSAFSPSKEKKSRNPDEISFAPSEAVKVSKLTIPTKTLNLF